MISDIKMKIDEPEREWIDPVHHTFFITLRPNARQAKRRTLLQARMAVSATQ